MIMSKTKFNMWVDSKLDSFSYALSHGQKPWEEMEDKLCDDNYLLNYINIYNGYFFIHCDLAKKEITIFNAKTKRSATARCHIDDQFSFRIGVAVAWAKYTNEAVPNYENYILRDELVNGDKFISSFNKNRIFTFVGWLPDANNSKDLRWAVVIDDECSLIKTKIAYEVIKI